MNYRLILKAEKEANARRRELKKQLKRSQKRRAAFLLESFSPGVAISIFSGAMSDEETQTILCGHLNKARHIMARRSRSSNFPHALPQQIPPTEIVAPQRTLQSSRRSLIFPCLTSPEQPEAAPVLQALENAARARADGVHAYDVLAGFKFSARMSWPDAMRVLIEQKVIPVIPEEILQGMEAADNFWQHLRAGAERFCALVKLPNPVELPTWAYFDRLGLSCLLPGIRLPQTFVRDEYLVKVLPNCRPGEGALDLYSLNFHPLIRHPLTLFRNHQFLPVSPVFSL